MRIDWADVVLWGLMVFIIVAVFLAAQTELRL
jgi:hypothetical protein